MALGLGEYRDDSIFIWLDILGFSNELEHLEKYKNLRDVLDNFRSLFKSSEWEDVSVSDGILIEIPFSNHFWHTENVVDLFKEIAKRQIKFLLKNDYVLRGGISVGKTIDKTDKDLGCYISDGMAGAYSLESKKVSWPIIGIDDSSLVKLRERCDCDEKEMFGLKTTVNETGLKIHFLDYAAVVDYSEVYLEKIDHLLKKKISELNESKNSRVLLKYIWLYKYFNESWGLEIPESYKGWVL